MRSLIILLTLAWALQASAQQSTTRGFGNFAASFINGKNAVSGQVSISGGVYRNSWYYGAGSAMDFYQYRTVPLYLTVTKDFQVGQLYPFGYVEAGRNLPAVLDKQRRPYYEGNEMHLSSFEAGWYSNAGIGLRFPGERFPAFALSLGLSTKSILEKWQEQTYVPDTQSFIVYPRSNAYTFNRFMIRAAFIF